MWRAKCAKADAQRYYDATAYHLAKVSNINHNLSYIVHKVGIFGGPQIEPIERLDNVNISENDDCVIIKDGYVYELTKRRA